MSVPSNAATTDGLANILGNTVAITAPPSPNNSNNLPSPSAAAGASGASLQYGNATLQQQTTVAQ